jgi:hypothetical protein
MEILRKRNTATTVYFPMIERDAADFETGWTPASGDVQYSVDGAAFSNTTNLPSHEGNGIYSLSVEASEINGALTVITVVDQGTKAVEDQSILIGTYGDSSALHKLNVIADYVLRRAFGSARTSSDGDSVSFRSALGAIAKLVNKIAISGSTLTVYQEDDSTGLGTQAVTSSAAADPITELDTSA